MKKVLIEKYGWECILDEMVPVSDVLDWRGVYQKYGKENPVS